MLKSEMTENIMNSKEKIIECVKLYFVDREYSEKLIKETLSDKEVKEFLNLLNKIVRK